MHPIVTKTLGSMVSLEVFGQQSTSGKVFFLLYFYHAYSIVVKVFLFRGPFNNYGDKMRGEGVKKCLFLSMLRV